MWGFITGLLSYWFSFCLVFVIWMVLRKNKHLHEKYDRDVAALERKLVGAEGERDLARRHVEIWRAAAMDAGVHVIPDLPETPPEPAQAPARRPYKPRKKKNVNVNTQDASPYGERTGIRRVRIGK